MFFILGIFIALSSLVAAIVHLNQTFASYYDFVGVVMVVGGTLAIAIITFPMNLFSDIVFRLKELFVRTLPNHKEMLNLSLSTHENILKGHFKTTAKTQHISSQILRDGVELIQLGFASDKIQTILKERLFQASEKARLIGSAFRSLSKYPPAFGLAGTVLGLVHLMRGVSDGMSPQETGVRMAIALVATFYGLLVANLVVNPIGEAITKNAAEDEKIGEIALQAILLAADRVNMLEAQEMLNSFVNVNDRVDFIGLTPLNDVESVQSEPGAA